MSTAVGISASTNLNVALQAFCGVSLAAGRVLYLVNAVMRVRLGFDDYVSWFVRLCLCAVTGFVVLVIFSDTATIGLAYGSIYQPYGVVLTFCIIVLCSITFWHSALFGLIFNIKSIKYRSIFFRSLDYVWYFVALFASALFLNELQITELLNRKSIADSKLAYIYERLSEIPDGEFEQSCRIKDNFGERQEIRFLISKRKLEEICQSGPWGVNRVEFARICDKHAMVWEENWARYQMMNKDDNETLLMNKILSICTKIWNIVDLEENLRRIDESVRRSSGLPLPRSGTWALIFALVTGLRLTKTTAETYDAYRDAKKQSG